jgi:hypothetical protein
MQVCAFYLPGEYPICPTATLARMPQAPLMGIVPPDECSGAVTYLQNHGFCVIPVDSLTSADTPGPRTRVNGKDLSAEEVVSLAIEKGWELP